MIARLRRTLVVLILVSLGVTLTPATAQDCDPDFGTPLDQLFTCPGTNGINVGTGDDTVNITGPVTGSIESGGGILRVFIIGPDGSLIATDVAISMSANGDIYLFGDISVINAAFNGSGINLTGGGSITSTGDISVGQTGNNGYGIYVFGNGNSTDIASTGDISVQQIGNVGFGIYVINGGSIAINGNISVMDITDSGYGIRVDGGGSIASTGDIIIDTTGVLGYGIFLSGDGSIDSNGDITVIDTGTNGYGIRLSGDGSIASNGDITLTTIGSDGYGIRLSGEGSIISNGDITLTDIGERGYGIFLNDGSITSIGDITLTNVVGGGYGIYIADSGRIASIGDIDVSATGDNLSISGIALDSGRIASTGDINVSTTGTETQAYGIYIERDGSIISNGDITLTELSGVGFGLYIGDDGNIVSHGNITVSTTDPFGIVAGIVLLDDGSIAVSGNITATATNGNATGILGGDGDQLVVIDARVSGSTAAVRLGGGDDRVNLRSNADIHGDILMGSGDDTVQIGSGSRVNGLIDGGDDTDTLIVGREVLCREESGALDRQTSTGALIDSINLSGDTFTFDGNTYDIENFEIGRNGISRRQCVPRIDDGRVNAYDIGGWAAVYCNTEDGVNLWPIDVNGTGQADVSVDGAAMRAALQQAVNGGANTLIASGPRGSSLWALSSNEYQAMGPDPRNPGEQYIHVFAPGTCGMGNSLAG